MVRINVLYGKKGKIIGNNKNNVIKITYYKRGMGYKLSEDSE